MGIFLAVRWEGAMIIARCAGTRQFGTSGGCEGHSPCKTIAREIAMREQKAEHGSRRQGVEKNTAGEDADLHEEQERAPSFLTARELQQAQDSTKAERQPGDKGLPRGAQKRTHRLLSDDDEAVTGKD
jgi:hypothetical protein